MRGEWGQIDDYFGFGNEISANAARMFCIWDSLNLSPRRSDYSYDAIYRLAERAINARIYPWLVAFCDQVPGSGVLLSLTEQDSHMSQMNGIARALDHRSLDEIINEDAKNGNLADNFPDLWFSDLLACRSTPMGDQQPEFGGGYLAWTTAHTPRDAEQTRRFKDLWEVSQNNWEGHTASHRPALAGEPPRIAEGWPARSVAQYFAGCDLLGAGGVIHGGAGLAGQASDLQHCVRPTGDALECCLAVSRVWKSGAIPSDANTGMAQTGTEAGCPLVFDKDKALRIYSEIQGNRATAVIVEPKPGFVLQAKDGWTLDRIVEQDIVLLRR